MLHFFWNAHTNCFYEIDRRCSKEVNSIMPDPSNPEKGKGQGMLGAFTHRAAIVCGGSGIDSTNITNECFEYFPKDNR